LVESEQKYLGLKAQCQQQQQQQQQKQQQQQQVNNKANCKPCGTLRALRVASQRNIKINKNKTKTKQKQKHRKVLFVFLK
jgi:hypothetical protein